MGKKRLSSQSDMEVCTIYGPSYTYRIDCKNSNEGKGHSKWQRQRREKTKKSNLFNAAVRE